MPTIAALMFIVTGSDNDQRSNLSQGQPGVSAAAPIGRVHRKRRQYGRALGTPAVVRDARTSKNVVMSAMTEKQIQKQVLQIAARLALPRAGSRCALIMKLFLQNRVDRMFKPFGGFHMVSSGRDPTSTSPLALPSTAVSPTPRPRFWQGCFAVFALSGLGLWAVYPADLPKASPAPKVVLAAPHPFDDTAQDAMPDAPMPVDLYRFALNALLVPLFDDSVPPRWTEVAVEFACGPETSVLIDGEPMVPGKVVPATAFNLRWTMARCAPLGRDSVELSGNVELVVVHKKGVLSAVVMPDRLRVDSHMGRAWLHGPFTAETSLDTLAAMPRPRTVRR